MAGRQRKGKRGRRRRTTSSVLLAISIASLVALVVVVGFLALTGDDEPARRRLRVPTVVSEEREVTVRVVDNDYEPRSLVVRPGAVVTWEFEGSLPHTVTDPGGAFDSGVFNEGDAFTLTFEEAGTYAYYCTLHHAMQGTLVVAEADEATPAP